MLAALASTSLGGCGAALEPDDVAIRFWGAVITDDEARALEHVRAAERDAVQIERDLLPVVAFEVGRYTVDGERATVATRLHLEESGRELVIPADTVLVRESGEWRVDYAASTALASRDGELGGMLSGIRQFSELLKRGIEHSTDELERTLPRLERELSGLESEIRRQLPELRQRLERFERELREALEPPPSSSPPPERIEI